MHFLFISTMSGSVWGGSEELWNQTAHRLLGAGHQVSASVHYWRNSAAAIKSLQTRGARIVQRKPRRLVNFLLKRLTPDPEAFYAHRLLDSTAPDFVVISCAAFPDGLRWCRACQRLDRPYVIVVQAVAEFLWPKDERRQQILDAYGGARTVFFVSRGNHKLAEAMLGARLPNAAIVRNPVNVDYDSAYAYPAIEPTVNLACVARLETAAKGQDLLLEVLSLEKWRQRNLRVSFYGTGTNAEGLQALARLLKLDQVTFHGHVGNVADVWKTHHLLVLPSRYEGLPLSLVEAMLCARPAVVTDVAGNAEVIDDNETGFVAAAPTVSHIDEALERAWSRRTDWAAMGIEAARRIRQCMPRDPIEIFTEEITRPATGSSSG